MRDVYIVTAERLRLRTEPHAEASILRYLVRGETVHRLEIAPGDDWWRVRLRYAVTGASVGWVAAEWLRERNPKPRVMSRDEMREKLKAFAPKGATALIDSVAEPLAEQLAVAKIDTPLRLQHFFAHAAYETDEFTSFLEGHGRLPDDYFREHCDPDGQWGPTLGNSEKDDGPRFKGRGMLMLAGRANYQAAADALGLDLINHPELVERPENAVKTAVWIWKSRDLEKWADADDVAGATRAFAGPMFEHIQGTESDRAALVNRARRVFR